MVSKLPHTSRTHSKCYSMTFWLYVCAWLLGFGSTFADFATATVTPSTTTIRGSGGSSITLGISGITLRDWSKTMLTLPAGCNSASVNYAGAAMSAGPIFFRTDNSVNRVLCDTGTATTQRD